MFDHPTMASSHVSYHTAITVTTPTSEEMAMDFADDVMRALALRTRSCALHRCTRSYGGFHKPAPVVRPGRTLQSPQQAAAALTSVTS